MKKILIYGISFLIIAFSCITPYEPKDVESTEGILVVEAMLLAPYGSEVKLSRTVSLNTITYKPVSGEVKIVSEGGVEYRMKETSAGIFGLEQELVYKENEKYALDIVIGGSHYRSEYVQPTQTPEVEALTWEYNEKYNQVDISVSVDNPNADVSYYQWKYEENWEITAPAVASHRWDPTLKIIIEANLRDSSNRYYCWGKEYSNHFILGSSEKMVSSTIRNNKVKVITFGDARVSRLYHIAVKQYALHKDAYFYFRNLQNNVEATGSIFAPQPTEMKGNITCLTNPTETVIGFFVATTETTASTFIEATEVPKMLNYRSNDCDEPRTDFSTPSEAFESGFGIYSIAPNTPIEYLGMRCVDCTWNRGTKNRPEWWPNDHY